MISHRHRCIYVKLPKCASTTVRDWFLAHAGGRHAFRPSWYPRPLPARIQSLGRLLDLYPGYFAFTFVRNPYRRFVSLYLHARRFAGIRAGIDPDHPASCGNLAEFAALCGELLADTRGLWGPEATAFLRERAERRYGPLGIPLRHLSFVFNHLRPQVDFLPNCNPERLFGLPRAHPRRLSFVGAVETLDADFGRLREVLGLPALPLPRRNASTAASETLDALCLDPATLRRVGETYAEDFAFARYSVGAVTGAPALPRRSCRPQRAARRPPPGTLLRRAGHAAASVEVGLEARIRQVSPLRRALAPIARLRRRLP